MWVVVELINYSQTNIITFLPKWNFASLKALRNPLPLSFLTGQLRMCANIGLAIDGLYLRDRERVMLSQFDPSILQEYTPRETVCCMRGDFSWGLSRDPPDPRHPEWVERDVISPTKVLTHDWGSAFDLASFINYQRQEVKVKNTNWIVDWRH